MQAGGPFYAFLSWELPAGRKVDLDVSAMCFDSIGNLVDYVFYNQEQTKDGALFHAGDQKGELVSERINIDLLKINPTVNAIVIVTTCFTARQTFALVETAKASLVNGAGQEILAMGLGGLGNHTAALVMMIFKDPQGNWHPKPLGLPCFGSNFVDVLPYTLQILEFDRLVDPNLASERKPLPIIPLRKGRSISVGNKKLMLGLGWDVKPGKKVDLDASVLMYSYYRKKDHVWFKERKSLDGAIHHRGDNSSGKGEGDDEVIDIDLSKVDGDINNIVCIVTIFTEGISFIDVANAYVRLVDTHKHEICRFNLVEIGAKPGLFFAKLYRQAPLDWHFEAIGDLADGRTMDKMIDKKIIGPYLTEAPKSRQFTIIVKELKIQGEHVDHIYAKVKYASAKDTWKGELKDEHNPFGTTPHQFVAVSEGISIQIYKHAGLLKEKHLGDVDVVFPLMDSFKLSETFTLRNNPHRITGELKLDISAEPHA